MHGKLHHPAASLKTWPLDWQNQRHVSPAATSGPKIKNSTRTAGAVTSQLSVKWNIKSEPSSTGERPDSHKGCTSLAATLTPERVDNLTRLPTELSRNHRLTRVATKNDCFQSIASAVERSALFRGWLSTTYGFCVPCPLTKIVMKKSWKKLHEKSKWSDLTLYCYVYHFPNLLTKNRMLMKKANVSSYLTRTRFAHF